MFDLSKHSSNDYSCKDDIDSSSATGTIQSTDEQLKEHLALTVTSLTIYFYYVVCNCQDISLRIDWIIYF